MSNFARRFCASVFRGLNRLRNLDPKLRRDGIGAAVVDVGWEELLPKSRYGIVPFELGDNIPTEGSSSFVAVLELITFDRKLVFAATSSSFMFLRKNAVEGGVLEPLDIVASSSRISSTAAAPSTNATKLPARLASSRLLRGRGSVRVECRVSHFPPRPPPARFN
eukprot:scaffold7923_cov154-Skeletonema_menzelii.AAC.2